MKSRYSLLSVNLSERAFESVTPPLSVVYKVNIVQSGSENTTADRMNAWSYRILEVLYNTVERCANIVD